MNEKLELTIGCECSFNTKNKENISQIESIFRCQNIIFNRGFSGGTSCYLSERWRFESHNRDVAEAAEC